MIFGCLVGAERQSKKTFIVPHVEQFSRKCGADNLLPLREMEFLF